MRTLFEIGAEFNAIDTIFSEEEAMEFADDAFNDWLDQLAEEEAVKLDNYCAYIHQLEMEATAAKAEAEQWQAKARSRLNRIDWLKGRMKQHMEQRGVTDLETATGRRIAIQANGGKLPLVLSDGLCAEELPAWFCTTVIDPAAIRAALEKGDKLDFARLGERGSHLRVR